MRKILFVITKSNWGGAQRYIYDLATNLPKENLEINPLNAIIIGFNVDVEEDAKEILGNVKVLSNDVVYKLIEDLQLWRTEKANQIEKEKLLGLATICKLEILHQYIFRNLNPAIFGVRVLAGRIRTGIPLIAEDGEEIARVKSIQRDKSTVEEAKEGDEIAIALPGVNFERRLKDKKYLYADISDRQFKDFKKNKDVLSSQELKVIDEISKIKNLLI